MNREMVVSHTIFFVEEYVLKNFKFSDTQGYWDISKDYSIEASTKTIFQTWIDNIEFYLDIDLLIQMLKDKNIKTLVKYFYSEEVDCGEDYPPSLESCYNLSFFPIDK